MRSDRAAHYEHVEMMVKYETTFKLVHRKVSLKKSAFVTKYRYCGEQKRNLQLRVCRQNQHVHLARFKMCESMTYLSTHFCIIAENISETKTHIFQLGGKDSGTKSILLLHRSQSFLLEFIKGLKNAQPRSKASAIAQEAYDSSIAKYYSWLVGQMASMAFSSLPPTQVSCVLNGMY